MIIPKGLPFGKTIRRLYFNSLNNDNDRYKAYCEYYHLPMEFFVGIGTVCEGAGNIVAGANSYANHYSCLKATKGQRILIGKDVRIGPYVYISTENADRRITKDILIKDGAFIGAHSFIREGVTIGRNAIVAANSVVLSDVKDNTMVAGSPAKEKCLKPAK